MRAGNELARKAYEILYTRIKESPMTVRSVEAHLGRSFHWWRSLRRSRSRGLSLTLGQFLDVCRFVGCDAAEILALAAASEPGLERSGGGGGAGVTAPTPGQLEASPAPSPPLATPPPPALAALPPALAALDEERLRDPEAVLKQLEVTLPALQGRERCQALAILGSCHRQLLQFDLAEARLKEALRIATPADAGDVYQRMVYARRYSPESGPNLARKAIELHARQANQTKLGEALIDLGYSHCMLGSWRAALADFAAASLYWEFLGDRHRVALRQLEAQALTAMGRTSEAHEKLVAARQAPRASDFFRRVPSFLAQIEWAQARLTQDPQAYYRAIKLLALNDPFDASCACIELAAVNRTAALQALRKEVAPQGRSHARIIEDLVAAVSLNRSLDGFRDRIEWCRQKTLPAKKLAGRSAQ